VTRVLVVDDDPHILRTLRITLHAHGYDVLTATGGRQALASAAAHAPDVVLLDLGLPDLDGGQIIRALRAWTTTPIVVLSGRADSRDKVSALDAGADDYVTKPFQIDELLARLRVVTRRTSAPSVPAVVALGDFSVDLDARRVTRVTPDAAEPDGDVRLTPTEWHILDVLLRNAGRLVTARHLLPVTGGPAREKQSHYLREYMARLRRKLEPDPTRPRYLITEPGMGYRFQPDPMPAAAARQPDHAPVSDLPPVTRPPRDLDSPGAAEPG
jgi:two-component system KDP operon response regulator KdpE